MPPHTQLNNRVIKMPGSIAYVSNDSPTSTKPNYVPGSIDIMTSISGYAQRRPGFADDVETTPTTFVNLQRLFTWDRFDESYYVIACDVNASGVALVYAYQVGIDASFVLIYTEATATSVPYDFVVSNDTLYFANGVYAKKWTPSEGVTNWGIAIGDVATSISAYAGTGTDEGTNALGLVNPWNNPGNIAGAPNSSYATGTVASNVSFPELQITNYLNASNYVLSVPAANTITGIKVSVRLKLDVPNVGWNIWVMQNGSRAGSPMGAFLSDITEQTYSFGNSATLWGANWTPTNINNSGFGVSMFFTVDGTAVQKIISVDSVEITVYSRGAPAVSLITGPLTATVGYQYVTTYGNSNTGHISSPSPISNVVVPATDEMLIPIVASIDPQVNQIHIYRTTDSATGLGGQSYFEIPASPVSNSSATVTVTSTSLTSNIATYTAANNLSAGMYVTVTGSTHDAAFNVTNQPVASASATQFTVAITNANIANAADAAAVSVSVMDDATDIQLNVNSLAPAPTFNDPPPAWKGMVYFSGRIWGYVGNKVWFTGLEEISVGVPEESVPSGVAGNYYSFDQQVNGIGVAGINEDQVLLVYCGGRVYGIRGNTLDTFRRFLVSNRRGSRNRTCISMMGGMCAWLDTSNQIWATNGSTLEELSIPIRPDLVGIDQSECCLTFHVSDNFHWLVFSTGERLFVYDIDQEMWMPPWSFSCQYLFSGETAPGEYQLMGANVTKALQLSTANYMDNGSTYQPVLRTALMAVIPDNGAEDQPTRTGVPYYVEVDTNAFDVDDVEYAVDDDPATATFTSIYLQKKSVETTFLRENGVNINQQIFPMNGPRSRWISLQVTLEDADQADKIYGLAVAFKEQVP